MTQASAVMEVGIDTLKCLGRATQLTAIPSQFWQVVDSSWQALPQALLGRKTLNCSQDKLPRQQVPAEELEALSWAIIARATFW